MFTSSKDIEWLQLASLDKGHYEKIPQSIFTLKADFLALLEKLTGMVFPVVFIVAALGMESWASHMPGKCSATVALPWFIVSVDSVLEWWDPYQELAQDTKETLQAHPTQSRFYRVPHSNFSSWTSVYSSDKWAQRTSLLTPQDYEECPNTSFWYTPTLFCFLQSQGCN